MSNLVLAVVALAAVVTVLLPRRCQGRRDPPDCVSRRCLARLPDDDDQLDGKQDRGSP